MCSANVRTRSAAKWLLAKTLESLKVTSFCRERLFVHQRGRIFTSKLHDLVLLDQYLSDISVLVIDGSSVIL